ncbi:hypothetical protein DPMN_073917 [Dreissena polymorpha]|uniref:Uncharacterized protein n=1 Tax=Dreissena polymorpha TaxID=45954 RepID=A0A9D4BL52_DREPO|nr:hypothetical protein DPMN_073917 [Dreissena polymorpha]
MIRSVIIVLSTILLVAYCQAFSRLSKTRARPGGLSCLDVCDSDVEYCDIQCKWLYGDQRPMADLENFTNCLSRCAGVYVKCFSHCNYH